MQKEKNATLTFWDGLTLAAGFTIGSGIITQTGIGIGMTGRSIFLAFFISAILFLVAFRPLFIMSSVIPHTSAAYTYSKELIAEEVGGLYAYIYFLGRITIAIFGISFAQYLSSLIPIVAIPGISKAVALSILTFFFLINLRGIKCAARIQNIMFFILVAGLISFAIYGLGKVKPDFFASTSLFTNGFSGFYSAVSLLFFAVGGAYIITDFAPQIKNASKIITRIIFIVTLSVCAIYMLLGIVASGVVDVQEAANQPLTLVAQIIYPNYGLFAFFIVGACLGALITTLNSSFVWYSNSLLNACEDGWFPRSLAKKNKYNVPTRLMFIFYLFGAIPTLLGIDLTILSKAAIGLTILSTCIPMLGILQLPKKYPEEWHASPYSRRYPIWRLRCMVIITYCVLGSQVYALFSGNPPGANILILVCCICILLYLIIHWKKRTSTNW